MKFNPFFALFIGGSIAILMAACTRPPEYPITPVIELGSMSPLTVRAGQTDSVIIKLKFTDGDGDITPDASTKNVFIIDPRTFVFLPNFNNVAATYSIPKIENKGVASGISGEIKLTFLPQTACEYEPGTTHPATDKVAYKIHIFDKAGNKSNVLQLPEITITNCQ